MSYRKIKVNDKIYEYVVGRNYVKIKGIGAFDNEHIGYRTPYHDGKSITPYCIRNLILYGDNHKQSNSSQEDENVEEKLELSPK